MFTRLLLTNLRKYFGFPSCLSSHNLVRKSVVTMPPNNCYKYMYLHGFASSKGSSKGVLLNKFFSEQAHQNAELQLPDLNIPSFEQLSVTEIVKHLKNEILSSTQQYRLIGSSLGGLVAATLASELKESSKIESLILLCPALDASNRWKAKMTETDLNQWKTEGSRKFYHFGTKSEHQLHYGFFDDLLKQEQFPLVHVPTTIIHGTDDDIVPIDVSHIYIERLREAGTDNELIEVKDDHLLMRSETIDVIKNVITNRWFNETGNRK